TLLARGADKVELLRRADRAARAADAKIIRVTATLSEEVKEILIVTSDGKLVRDRQPLVRFGAQAVAESETTGRRQAGSSGGGGRMGLEYFDAHTPESHCREAARVAIQMLGAREAPAGATAG